LLVIGAVTRLIYDQAKNGVLPSWLSFKNSNNVPSRALLLMFAIHFSMFILYAMHTVNIEQLVNALLGVLIGFVSSMPFLSIA
jgi:APA family basic amino acid/polyamine antiporter